MNCFIITYDLCNPGRDYSSLYGALKAFPKWGKITESTWAVVSDSNAIGIRDHLLGFIDSNDRLFVIKSGREAAWNRAFADNQWLKDNLIL